MTVTLYTNSSAKNVVSKSISSVATLSGTLRESCDILDPEIMVERSSPTGFNYMHIAEFGRYYFITDVVVVQNNLLSIRGHVDVLMTYSSGIRSMKAVVRRQENNYNLMLDDGVFKSYQNTKHKIIAWPNSFDSFSYVLALAGNGGN